MDLPRFLTLSDVADLLNVSAHQAYLLVRTGDLAAIRVGGRGEWRISEADLAEFIARQYAEVRRDRVRDAVH